MPAASDSPSTAPLALTLPARYYTDPEVFRAEIERFFVHKWACVGRADEVPERGGYVVRDLAGESLILLRDAAGAVRAHANVCRHRGTRLCTEASGRFGGTIRCPYHAWTYDLSGRLLGAPHMDDVPGFRKEDWPLLGPAVADWDGHLFVHLGEDPPPLASQLGDLPAKFRPWGMAELRIARTILYDVAANWKLILLNYSECLHCPSVHPALNRLSHYLSGDNEPPGAMHLGGAMSLRAGIATMTFDGTTRRACLPGLDADRCRKVLYYAVLPNLLLSLHPDGMMTHRLHPRAVDRTEIVCSWHFHPDEMARPDFDPDDLVAFWDLTNRQDWQVCELSQQGLSSRFARPGPYSGREGLLGDLDRLILRELEGRA
jgi:Rieske 2Fe-2S family protein